MRSPQWRRQPGGGLVEVDDRPVSGDRFPRSQIGVVSFCETPSTGQQVRWSAPIVGGAAVVRNAEFGANDGCGCGCPQCGVRKGAGRGVSQKLTSGRFSPRVSPGCKTLLSAFTKPRLPDGRSVGVHPLLAVSLVSAMRSLLGYGNSWVPANDGCGRGCPQCASPHDTGCLWVHTNCWCRSCCPQCATPQTCNTKRRHPPHKWLCGGCLLCEVVGSAVTYSPTPSRGQYHRRGRA